MHWIYKGKEIKSHSDLPDNCTDIVYGINYTDGKHYLGKKTIRSERRLQPTKAQLAIRKNYKRVELKDLPFVNYEGSSKENEGKVIDKKVIVYCCSNKRTATYLEAKLLFTHHAIESDDVYTNQNILGKMFSNCLDGLIRD